VAVSIEPPRYAVSLRSGFYNPSYRGVATKPGAYGTVMETRPRHARRRREYAKLAQ
jgi:hypothetical protein